MKKYFEFAAFLQEFSIYKLDDLAWLCWYDSEEHGCLQVCVPEVLEGGGGAVVLSCASFAKTAQVAEGQGRSLVDQEEDFLAFWNNVAQHKLHKHQ